ncbi:MAG: hypothetical protein PWP23_3253 [Candidatus Sumerlaeota bacterium]|nr:hypothetical protein [Candidatus Sumerlaeota bacterium]
MKKYLVCAATAAAVFTAGSLYAQGYVVDSVLYSTDFETDVSADFTVAEKATGDNAISFVYDYSTFAQADSGFPTSIPAAPSAAGTKGLQMSVNNAATAVNAIGVYLTAGSFTPADDMLITFDAWINYNGGAAGGSGSTEFLAFGAGDDTSLAAYSGSNYSTSVHDLYSGFFFAHTGEGGAGQDYRYHDGDGTNPTTGGNLGAAGGNEELANLIGQGANELVNNLDQAWLDTFPDTDFATTGYWETAGAPGKAWITYKIAILGGQVRVDLDLPDGSTLQYANWFTPNAGTPMTGLLPYLGCFDNFSSSANPASDNFYLFDNLKVESILAQASAENWNLYE